MPTLTAQQLEYLRGNNQRVETFITVIKPPVLWAATVTGAPAREARAIPFQNGAGPNFGGIAEYYTVLIGTTAGADNVGRVRVRSVTSGDSGVTGTLNAAGNEIAWADGQHLTFLQTVDPWSMFPRIDLDEVFYKDYDVAYTDQNSNIYPVCIAGPEVQAGFITAGNIIFQIPIGDSYALAPGATITGRTVTVTPSAGVTVGGIVGGKIPVTITNPGQYFVKATVTDSNGKVQDSWRWLVAHYPDPASVHYPFTDASSISGQADWEGGGWSAKIRVNDNGSLANFPDKTRVLIWQRPWYEGVQTAVSFFEEGQNAVLCGYLRNADIGRNKASGGYVDFEVVTLNQILREYRFMFSISLESVATPDTWWKYLNGALTAGRIVHHVWRWHSTLFHICDMVGLLNDDGILRKYAEFEKSNLYNMVDDLIRNQGIYAHMICDKNGRFHMARDLAYGSLSQRNAASIIADIAEEDTVDELTLVENPNERVAFVFFSGILYNGTDADPIGSTAPSTWPSPYGSQDMMIEQQMIGSQAYSNQMAGQVFAVENRRLIQASTDFHGNYLSVMEPAVMAWWRISIAAGDTPREEAIINQRLLCRSVSFDIDVSRGLNEVSVSFEPEVNGTDGVPYQWPTVAPETGGHDPGVDAEGTNAVITASSLQRLPYSAPLWTVLTDLAVNDANRDPWWRTKTAGTINQGIIYLAREGEIRKSVDGGWSSTPISLTNPPNDAGDAPAPTAGDLSYVRYDGSVYQTNHHVFLARWQNSAGDWRSWLVRTVDDWATHNWVALPGAADGGGDWGPVAEIHANSTFAGQSPTRTAVPLSNNKVAVLYRDGTASGGKASMKIGTIVGDTVTYGTATDVPMGVLTGVNALAMVKLSGDHLGIAIEGPTATIRRYSVVVAEWSSVDDSLTFGTPVQVPDATIGGSSIFNVAMTFLGDNRVLLVGGGRVSGTDPLGVAVAWTYSGTSATVGTPVHIRSESSTLPANSFDVVYYTGDRCIASWSHQKTGSTSAVELAVLTVTIGPAVSVGDIFTAPGTGGAIGNFSNASLAPIQDGNRSVLVWDIYDPSTFPNSTTSIRGTTVALSGTSIIFGGEQIIKEEVFVEPDQFKEYYGLMATPKGVNSFFVTCTYHESDGVGEHWIYALLEVGVTVHTLTEIDYTPLDMVNGEGTQGFLVAPGVFYGAWNSRLSASPTYSAILTSIGQSAKGDCVKFSRGGGDFIYVTGCDGNQLFLQLFDSSTLGLLADLSLGAASLAQFDAKLYWCQVLPLYGDEEHILVYGRMNNPAGWGDPAHLIYSQNGGVTFDLLNNDLENEDYFGSILQTPAGLAWGVVNRKDNSPQLWRAGIAGLSMSLRTTLTTLGNAGVNPESLRQDAFGNLVLASDKPQLAMVIYVSSPFVGGGVDVTYNHDTTRPVNSVIVL